MAAALGMKVALPVKAVGTARSGLQRCRRASIGSARGLGTSPARQHVVAGAAAAMEPSTVPGSQVAFLPDDERQKYAESIGFTKVGKHLPDEVTLQDVIKSMPSEVFELNPWRAWGAVVTSILSFALAEYLISISPWYLLPFAWAFAGTAFTGWFVVGHDCGHRSFSKNKLVEDIVGTIAFMPLVYPFEPWRIKHNVHHAYTNKLVDDTAWHPMTKESLETMDSSTSGFYKFFLGTPLKLWASIGHWWIWHFDLSKYSEAQKPRVKVSLAAVYAFMFIGWPLLIYYTGIGGWAKYWLMPWLGYHFWMSTFTLVHHTSPHIPFKGAENWNPAQAQLAGTVHCDYPSWVEFLCHDISVHIPHHVNAKIPWYNLRKAHESLKQNWGEYMNETTFNWRMIKQVITHCHIYDEENNYVPFDYEKEEPLLAFQRKVLPDTFQ